MQIDGWNPKDIGYDTGYNHTYGVGIDADAKSTGAADGSKGECQTCKNRKYQDGSNENVSFKSAIICPIVIAFLGTSSILSKNLEFASIVESSNCTK